MGSCIELGTFLQCGLSDTCANGGVDKKKCMFGLSKEIGNNKITNLKADCDFIGLYLHGIEDVFEQLCHSRGIVDIYDSTRGHLNKPWGKIVAKSAIVPLVCSTTAKDGELRPSEFGCAIARILSKVDLNRVQELFNITIERRLAEIGTTRHELCLTQHCDNFEHAELACLPPRDKYCETPVAYIYDSKALGKEIIIPGRLDCRFTFEDNHAIGVIDLKRGRHFYYIKNAHKRQTLIYALALAQQLGGYDTAYTIVLEGPFKPEPFKYRFPQKHIIKYKLNSPEIDKLHKELEGTYTTQAKVLDNLEYFLEKRDSKAQATNGCIKIDGNGKEYPCFDKPACDALCTYCSQSKRSLRDVIDDFKLTRKGYRLPQL